MCRDSPTQSLNGSILFDIAHARSGDKGNKSNIVVIPYDDVDYDYLESVLTAERVMNHFNHLIDGKVTRYEIPSLSCLNFVLEGALDGGVTVSTRLDRHGKSLSYHMLRIPLD